MEKLENERSQLPNSADLDCAIETLADAQRLLDTAAAEAHRRTEFEQQAKRTLGMQDAQCRDCCRGLPYVRSEDAYEEAQAAVEEYSDQLNEINRSHVQGQASQQRYEEIEADLAIEYDRISAQKNVNAANEEDLKKTQAVIQEIEAYLARPENVDRARRIQELDDLIQSKDQEEREAENQCVALTARIDGIQAEIQRPMGF